MNFHEKKKTCKTQNAYILLDFLLVTMVLLITNSYCYLLLFTGIYCYLIKYQENQ